MKLTIYLDVLLVTNFIINYFLLKAAAFCCRIYASAFRLIAASLAAAFFSVFIVADVPFVFSFLFKIMSLSCCSVIAFGIKNLKTLIKVSLYLVALTFTFTGVVILFFSDSNFIVSKNMYIYMNISPLILIGCILLVYISLTAFEFVFESSKKDCIYSVEIWFGYNSVLGSAFYDTGFKIKDIITFRTVILTDYFFVSKILNESLKKDIEMFFASGTYNNNGIIPVFYSDLSGKGMMPGIKAEKVIIKNTNKTAIMENILLAVCPEKISREYDVIFGKDIINMVGGRND